MKYKQVKGIDIPEEVIGLTLPNGMMKVWLANRKKDMVAILAYDGKELVGWATFFTRASYIDLIAEVGVFVSETCRKKGLGTKLVKRLLVALSEYSDERPIQVRYGSLSEYFNQVYEREIAEAGFIPIRWFC